MYLGCYSILLVIRWTSPLLHLQSFDCHLSYCWCWMWDEWMWYDWVVSEFDLVDDVINLIDLTRWLRFCDWVTIDWLMSWGIDLMIDNDIHISIAVIVYREVPMMTIRMMIWMTSWCECCWCDWFNKVIFILSPISNWCLVIKFDLN